MATIIPDGGRPYVSKVFNDSWMREHGYLGDTGRHSVGELLREKKAPGPILTVGSHDTVGQALELMREHGGLAGAGRVVRGPGRAFVGTVSERGLLWASADHPGILGEQVTEVLEAPLPELGRRPRRRRGRDAARGRRRGDRARGRTAAGGPDRSRPRRGAEPVSRGGGSRPGRSRRARSPDPTYGSVIPPIHQSLDLRAARPRRVHRRLRLRALGEPDPRRAGERARPARGRPRDRVRERDGRDPRR